MTRPLTIGIDGRAFASPAAGVRRYIHALASALAALDDAPDLVALGGDRHTIPRGLAHVGEPGHPPTNLGWTLVGLPRAASRAKVDIIHAPSYTAPLIAPAPVVLTVHDVSYARHPEWYPYRRDIIRRAFYRRSAHAAAHLLTDSDFSAVEIEAAYGIAPARITVVPLGVDPAFAADAGGMASPLPTEIEGPFLLHVGDLHARRNVEVVVEALAEVRRHFGRGPAVSLVLAGVDRGSGAGLCAMAAGMGLVDAVIPLGSVGEDLLHALYRAASALVYPSRYEGFGLPLVEAMASGVPVLASQAASIPEVVGDAGVLLDPDDASAWALAILDVLNDVHVRTDLIARGRARAAAFTWERTARATLEVYRRVGARQT